VSGRASPAGDRPLDVVCIGRAAVDLYGDQIGARLEDVHSFSKYLGGSPANTSVGASRLGLRAAMLTRVGDEHNGRFVREQLQAEGVDVSQVRTDAQRLTALAFLALRDRETFPLLFYRHDCADMALAVEDIDPGFIARATGLLVSGTHLSRPGPYAACDAAMRAAREAGTRVILDIDYRPVLWGLTGLGLGEQRFVASDSVSAHLQTVLPLCDLVVGTEEEIHIAGGSTDTLAALRRIRQLSTATVVVKRGPMGCVVFEGEIPESLDGGVIGPGFPVEVFNVLGAGDAFMAGFLRGWLRDEPLLACARWANACGALVVSRHGCAPAMPSWIELQHFLQHGPSSFRVREDVALEHLHRASTRQRHWPELLVLAFDHRAQFEDIAARHGRDEFAIRRFKALIADGLQQGSAGRPGSGVILDSRFGDDLLPALTGRGLWVARPVELPGSRPLQFEPAQPLALALRAWPAEHVVKCLLSYHPNDEDGLRAQQIERLAELQQACHGTGHEMLIEVIPPRELPADESTLPQALEQLYTAGLRPDWWKLPPCATDAGWRALSALIERHDPLCRGVLVLGLEASEDHLEQRFRIAAPHAVCKGFAVGRSIFADAATAWFAATAHAAPGSAETQAADAAVVDAIAQRYARLITRWDEARGVSAAAPTSAPTSDLQTEGHAI
jgi:5-dehydro-2-deoxygluconokinase